MTAHECEPRKFDSISVAFWLLAMLVGAVCVATVRQLAAWWFA